MRRQGKWSVQLAFLKAKDSGVAEVEVKISARRELRGNGIRLLASTFKA